MKTDSIQFTQKIAYADLLTSHLPVDVTTRLVSKQPELCLPLTDTAGADDTNILVYLDKDKLNQEFTDNQQHSIENEQASDSIQLVIGVDEAGRGPLLGSVVVGAVILPSSLTGEFECIDITNSAISQLNDSKKISEKKRDKLHERLDAVAIAYAYVDVPAAVIDTINILQASLLGMRLATDILLEQITKQLSAKQLTRLSVTALFDGNKVPSFDYNKLSNCGIRFGEEHAKSVIKGDSKHTSIAMASVLAKVERDKQMYLLAEKYPNYGIAKHKGYPTKAHLSCLQQYGVLKEHRKSFAPVRNLLANN